MKFKTLSINVITGQRLVFSSTLLASLLTLHGEALQAQGEAERNVRNVVKVREKFDPAFAIEPLSQSLTGRSNEVVAFQFKIESPARETMIQISPVGLRQEPSGMILNDESAAIVDNVELVSPSRMSLRPDDQKTIEGFVRIPTGAAKLHTLGLMVKDFSGNTDTETQRSAPNAQQTTAGVRFITQYVLRLDINVESARGEDLQRMKIESVSMIPFQGRPKIRCVVDNPTASTFEFQMHCRLRSSPSDRSFGSLNLTMPVRNSMEGNDRYNARILPGSKLYMEELLPEAIAEGTYDVDMEIVAEGRTVVRKTLPVEVHTDDFPAQEVLIGQAAQGLQVSPTQIEMSQHRGGSRRLTMVFRNSEKDRKTIRLAAYAANDLKLDTIIAQPDVFDLSPQSTRKVSITMLGQTAPTAAVEYGRLMIECQSDRRDSIESKSLPLALIYDKLPETSITVEPLKWDPSGSYPMLTSTIHNNGESHIPLDGRISIENESGQRQIVFGGFGRWLLPHQQSVLQFRTDTPLPAGRYMMRYELKTGGEPVLIEKEMTIGP